MRTTGLPNADRVAPVQEPAFELIIEPDEVTHLVCCRDISWSKTFCGEDGDAVNMGAHVICTMCVEWADSREPGCWQSDPAICPVDGRPCPPEGETDQRIARETRPTQ